MTVGRARPPGDPEDHGSPGVVVVRMWEGRAVEGREADAVAWLRDVAVSAALDQPDCLGAEAFAGVGGGDAGLVVLITRWDRGVPPAWHEAPPDGLLVREHAWPFRPL